MGRTSIDYVRWSFSPWVGCAKRSLECQHCYAEAIDKRFYGGGHWGKDASRRWQSDAYWDEPKAWNARAAKAGRVDRVLCGTMCDVLEPRASLHRWRWKLARLIHATPNLLWLLLSKAPKNQHLLASTLKTAPNVILGTTAGTVETVHERMPQLLEWPGRVWLSAEPLLEYISIAHWVKRLSFVVVGCESGPARRLMRLDWARTIRDECTAHSIPYFFKQAEVGTQVVHVPPLDGKQWLEVPHE